ncbi:hypothetical protein OB920_09970 [Halobacteria archaeon HArc-gm2]|nr:hypothetical protein [Halobacteria archaeon HArc-gm2]
MSERSPSRLPSPWITAGIVVLWMAWVLYSLIIIQQILLGLLPGVVLLGGYVAWRFLSAFEAIADGLQRIADQQERDSE